MNGVEYILARLDGMLLLDFWGELTTSDGATINVQLVGHMIPSPGKPIRMIGSIRYRTENQKYQHLKTLLQVKIGSGQRYRRNSAQNIRLEITS